MENEKIVEWNTEIAKFIGNASDDYGDDVFTPRKMLPVSGVAGGQGVFEFDELRFHESWDWLMLAIEEVGMTDPYQEPLSNVSLYSPIELVYEEVAKFCKEYNEEQLRSDPYEFIEVLVGRYKPDDVSEFAAGHYQNLLTIGENIDVFLSWIKTK